MNRLCLSDNSLVYAIYNANIMYCSSFYKKNLSEIVLSEHSRCLDTDASFDSVVCNWAFLWPLFYIL